jgi:hypothetical protein
MHSVLPGSKAKAVMFDASSTAAAKPSNFLMSVFPPTWRLIIFAAALDCLLRRKRKMES